MLSTVGKPIDWNDGFCLYMTTKLSNPNFSPEIMNKTNVINYQVCSLKDTFWISGALLAISALAVTLLCAFALSALSVPVLASGDNKWTGRADAGDCRRQRGTRARKSASRTGAPYERGPTDAEGMEGQLHEGIFHANELQHHLLTCRLLKMRLFSN